MPDIDPRSGDRDKVATRRAGERRLVRVAFLWAPALNGYGVLTGG